MNGTPMEQTLQQAARRAAPDRLYDPADVDERGRAVLALTGSLLETFLRHLPPTALPVGRADGAPGRGRVVVDRTGQYLIRGVSHIVWAYLAGGAPLPAGDDPAADESAPEEDEA